MEVANETVIKKPKRLTSVVWNHFERVRKADLCYALLSAKKRKKENTLTIANISYDEGQRKEEYLKPTIVKYEPEQRKDEVFNLPDLDLDLALSDEEWEWASSITGYLKLFVEIINVQLCRLVVYLAVAMTVEID
ncbi:hypothetical protein GOBAR_DD21741 [Gossypium barbadense]|nr:hypothetical protein GOBAR_DD21741 [Gossypium barbadense]